jgi:hypothetical protein
MRIASTLLLALLLCLLHAAAPAQPNAPPAEPAAELKALTDAYGRAEQAFLKSFRDLKSDAERQELWNTKHPARDFLPRFQALAKRAQGTETGAHALNWILDEGDRTGSKEAVREALRTLTTAYLQSPVLEDAAVNIGYLSQSIGAEECERALRTIAAQSPHRQVQAAATYTLATLLAGNTESKPEARRLFDTLQKKYAGTRYAEQAGGYIFEMENLQIGMKAPDFTATDQDGKTFKLSDYRGKVVVLDFWGFW